MWARLLAFWANEAGQVRKPLGAVIVAVAVGITGSSIIIREIVDEGGGVTCDLDATTANFASQVSAATTGQTICLTESASYGTFTGTNKAITITPDDGISPSMDLTLANGDSDFTLDGQRDTWDDSVGLTIGPSSFTGAPGPQDITLRDSWVTGNQGGGLFEIDGPTDTNMLFDHLHFFGADGDSTEAYIRWSYGGVSGVTVQDSLFRDSGVDGLKMGAAATVLNNKFLRITPEVAEQHTDAIQIWTGGGTPTGAIIRGNWVDDCEQAIGGFDGIGPNVFVDHNLVTDCSAWQFAFFDDDNSLVQWNTVANPLSGGYGCDSKAGFGPSTTSLSNNIGSIDLDTGSSGPNCTPTVNTNNMWSGASSPNINGTPTFVGGGTPTTWAGFCLTGGSDGKTGATDGTEVGICGGSGADAPPAGPPTGEGW